MKKIVLILLAGILLAGCNRMLVTTALPPTQAGSPTLQPGPFSPPDWSTLPEVLPKSMKGYELVCWQVGEDWNYTLVTGTNREKSFEELISPGSMVTDDGYVKISVTGLDQIKEVISHLPAGEQIIWSGMDLGDQVAEGTLYFSYPPNDVITGLFDYCRGLDIDLVTLQQTE